MNRDSTAAFLARNRFQQLWDGLRHVPRGDWAFSKLLGLTVPYTGTLAARVETLARGEARVTMTGRRLVRNHARRIHSMALANLAELAGNLAFMYSLPEGCGMRFTGMTIDFLEEARGRVTAVARCETPLSPNAEPQTIEVALSDEAGRTIARATLRSRVTHSGSRAQNG